MKKYIFLLLSILTVISTSAQSASWVNYELVISPENVEKFTTAFDVFYKSEGAKKMPTGFFTENTLGNQDECTHHMSFQTSDPNVMTQFLNPLEFWSTPYAQELGQAISSLGIAPKRAFSGLPLVESKLFPDAQNGIQVIWALNVPFTSQVDVVTAFKTFIKEMQPYFDKSKMQLGLHQHLAGDDRGTNFWILASHKDYAQYLETMNYMGSNPNFGAFVKAMGNTENTSTILRTVMKAWNLPSN